MHSSSWYGKQVARTAQKPHQSDGCTKTRQACRGSDFLQRLDLHRVKHAVVLLQV